MVKTYPMTVVWFYEQITSKEGTSQCQEKHAVLLSPVGKLEISGCETGVHEIKLPRLSVLPNG